MVGYQRWCRPSDPSEHLLTSSIVAVSVSAAAVHYIHWFLHILLAKMSDSNRKKRHRKKSFLHKLSRAFAGKPKKNNDESESSDDELKGETSSSHETSPEKSSATSTSTSPSSKQLVQVHNIISPENIDKVGAPLKLLPPSGQHENPDKGLSISDVKNAVDNSAHEGAVAPSRPPRNKGIPAAQGSDRHLTAKTNFISVSPTITSQSERIKNSCVDNSEIFDVSEGLKVVTTTSANELLKTPTLSEDLTQKLIRKERKYHSDSDESDTTEYSSEDENLDLIESEISKQSMEDLYFTTGKYISYFFLEMERQNYDPNKEVYRVIHYHDTSEQSMKKGDQSSSDSASPGIHMQMRNKLLHRGSADNLIINSQANFMQHSSPESVKSAPIRLKSRSTSHDALARRKERQFALTEGASMDNLAKQSLLAAQVLNLIPTQKARERNFLHGRIAANSLLGPVELEKVLPNREVKIFVGTWNMNGQTPPKELNDFMLPSEIQTIPDILAIGTQESCSERGEWEAALQETLGPSHVLLTSTSLGTLHLALFLRRELIWFCSVPEESSFSTRPGTAFRTKGAVALALMLFGTSFLFVTAHLTAHQDKVKERVSDIKRIIRNLDLPKDLPTKHKNKDVTQNFDCVFWCGDLNFRLAQPREEVIQWVSNMCFPQPTPISLAKDQLRMTLNEGAVLRGFEEGPITFPPTYKYDPGTQNFDTSSKQRTPAYTDRILFKGKGHTRGYIRRVSHESNNSQKDGNIECLVYDSVPSICTSDHKPVWGVFKTTVRPGIDTIPLAAGLFNREIYLEGIKRRAAAMDDSYGTSKVCSLQ